MKRILVLLLAVMIVSPLFAVYTSEEKLTTSAEDTLSVTLDLSNGSGGEDDDSLYSVEIGFSSGVDLSGFNETSYSSGSYTEPQDTNAINLILGDATAKDPGELYVYWIIKSAQGLKINLAMPKALSSGDPSQSPLSWTAFWGEGEGAKTIGDPDYNDDGEVVLDRSEVTQYGTVGAEKISIETGNILSAAPGTYTGTLKLIITAVDASQSDQSNS